MWHCSVCQQSWKDWYKYFHVCRFFFREQVLCHDTCMHTNMYINTCFVFPLSCQGSFYVQVLFREMFSKWNISLLPVSWRCCEGLCRAKFTHKFLTWVCDLAKLCKHLKGRTGRCAAPGPCGEGVFWSGAAPGRRYLLAGNTAFAGPVGMLLLTAGGVSPHITILLNSRTSRRRQPSLKHQGLMTWPVRHHRDVQ